MVTARREHNVEVIGPMMPATGWQKRAGTFDVSDFTIDWDNEQATCPQGKVSKRRVREKHKGGSPDGPASRRRSTIEPTVTRRNPANRV